MAVLALAAIVVLADPLPVREIRLRGFDTVQRLWPQPADDILIETVAIDDESLRRWGQWPWPRTLVADLVRRIAAGKPRVLGIDILFAEPDRLSPPLIAKSLRDLPQAAAEALAGMPSSEQQLAGAIAAVPTVLGLSPTGEATDSPAAPHRGAAIRLPGGDVSPFLTRYPSMVRSLPEIRAAARAEAATTDEPDEDGVVRAVPLLSAAAGQLVAGFAVELVRVAADIPVIEVASGSRGIEKVQLGPFSLPTDTRGRGLLRFAPPRPRYVSAARVLDPAFDPAQFEDRIVLLGVTGLGILDEKSTPLGPVPGVAIQAQLIESLLRGSLLRQPAGLPWIEFGLVLAAGLAMTGLVRYDNPRLAAASALGIAAILLGGEVALFGFAGWLVDGIYPAAAALGTFGAMLGGSLRSAQLARRRLAAELDAEREANARMEGEFAAARAVQMSLLPLRFPAFPERRDFEIYARIEPARVVGGDLFDFLLIDDSRLFFIIADVSGKGMPAALAMAMTKQIVRDAVQRHGIALDRLMTEANIKTAAASEEMGRGGDMMFVTAFAGILDLASGELAYASAGHDAPFLLQAGGGLRQLETCGGPPLGAVEHFRFPVDRDRCERDAVLLLYTDGVTEAQNPNGALYSVDRLSALLGALPAGGARAVVDTTFDDVRHFAGEAEPADDITLLAIRRCPN
jgi:adenylate cyclase